MKPTLIFAGFLSALLSTDAAAQQGCRPIAKADSIVPPEVRQNCAGNMVLRCNYTFQCMQSPVPQPKGKKPDQAEGQDLKQNTSSERAND